MGAPGQVRWNVLSAPFVRTALKWPLFPVCLQALALVVIALLAANGLSGGGAESEAQLPALRKAHLTTLVVWGLWWPAMIAVALTLGRLWCIVCPLELAHRLGDRLARALGHRRLGLPRVMRAGWAMLCAYLLLQVLAATASLDRSPPRTGLLLLGLAFAALASGLLFRTPRAFCRGLCPAAPLLSVYSRFTPVQLDVNRPEVCERCVSKECVRADHRQRFDARSCPSALKPYSRRQLDGCIVCLQCAKACPKGNVAFGVMAPSAPSRVPSPLLPFAAAYLGIDAGFVTKEFVEDVAWLEAPFQLVPHALHRLLPMVDEGWLEALWSLGLFPALLWSAVAGLGYVLGYRDGPRSLLLSAIAAAAPIIALAHLAKAGSKAAAWAGYLPWALRDPSGQRVLAEGSLPGPVWAVAAVGWLALLATAAFAVQSLRRPPAPSAQELPATRAGVAVATLHFSLLLGAWVRG